jgi:hypothetical protein
MGKKTVFVLAMALLSFIYIIENASAVESLDAEYERYYPKYVDSKEPLTTIKLKDIKELRNTEQKIGLQSIPTPIVMPYGIRKIQQLNIYRLPGDERKPVLFFIHMGAGDKINVVYAVPAWLSLGYIVVSINHRSVPDKYLSGDG